MKQVVDGACTSQSQTMENSTETGWHNWFFRSHNPAELQDWTARMHFFRFYRATGGHANDGDSLRCALRVDTEAELIAVTQALGINLRELLPDEPQPILGKQYTVAEVRRFRSRIEPFPRFEQLGRIRLASVECSAHVWNSRLELELSGAAGDPFEVSEADVANAVRVEQLLLPIADKVLRPPLDDKRCFSGAS